MDSSHSDTETPMDAFPKERSVDEADLRFLSPLMRWYLGIYGQYTFDVQHYGASAAPEALAYWRRFYAKVSAKPFLAYDFSKIVIPLANVISSPQPAPSG